MAVTDILEIFNLLKEFEKTSVSSELAQSFFGGAGGGAGGVGGSQT